MDHIGQLTNIWRYPVKSMAGEPLAAASVTLQGIAGDRGYAFVQADATGPFPWLTGRKLASMLQYRPAWGGEPGAASLAVRTPAGRDVDIASDELRDELARESGANVHMIAMRRGTFDNSPISLISHATIARIAEASGTDPNPGRFRMNFYVDTVDGEPFAEDAWVGRILRIGDTVRIAVTQRDKRCAMITLDPRGEAAAPPVLRAVAQLNDATAGVYAVVLTPGEVREGDAIVAE